MGLLESILISILTGVISGFTANIFYTRYLERSKIRRILKELNKFVGDYNVYHLQDLENPDSCNYQINISVDKKHGMLKVIHYGNHGYDEWIATVTVYEPTFTYGSGTYIHPKKDKTPNGKIYIHFINSATIIVDKEYLNVINNTSFTPGFEKWQWRKK